MGCLWLPLLLALLVYVAGVPVGVQDGVPGVSHNQGFWKPQKFNETEASSAAFLASAAYCDLESLMMWNCSACVHVPYYNVSGGAYDPLTQTFGYLGIGDKGAVLAFRGTDPDVIWNDITDFVSMKRSPFPAISGAEVGSGFLAAYTVLSKELKPQIELMLKLVPDIPLLITGHSLGGALAQMVAADVFIAHNRTTAGGIHLYSFGSPRVGNLVFASAFSNSDYSPVKSWRITHAFDPVVHLPPETMGFRHSAPEVWYALSQIPSLDPGLPGPFKECTSIEDPDCANSVPGLFLSDHLSYMGFAISDMCCDKRSCSAGTWGICCEQKCDFDIYHCACLAPQCDFRSGACFSTCFSTENCESGYYGYSDDGEWLLCDKKCNFSAYHCACPAGKCTTKSGTCGYDTCSYEWEYCASGYYGSTSDLLLLCDKKCDFTSYHCGCRADKCRTASGTCFFELCEYDELCQSGYYGTSDDGLVLCDKQCDFLTYHCGCPSEKCDYETGTCSTAGCFDEELCEFGYYGWSEDDSFLLCDRQCEPCKDPSEQCDSHTGQCSVVYH